MGLETYFKTRGRKYQLSDVADLAVVKASICTAAGLIVLPRNGQAANESDLVSATSCHVPLPRANSSFSPFLGQL